jgi:hypothetical protein
MRGNFQIPNKMVFVLARREPRRLWGESPKARKLTCNIE